MAKKIESLSGRVKLASALDSERYQYLSLSQAEPNLGKPESLSSLVFLNPDGSRSLVTEPLISGLSFRANSLDSADEQSFHALFIKGDPFDGTVDSVAVRRIDAALFEEDTLDTVTSRGNQTINSITVGGVLADSVTILGNLTVQGTTTSIDTTILTIEDKNIVIASGASNAQEADSAGITVAGANANIYYNSTTNSWNIDRETNIDSNLSVAGKLYIGDAKTNKTNLALYLDETTGEVYTGTPGGEVAPETNLIRVAEINTDSNFYPTFIRTLNGADSAKVDQNFYYNPSENKLYLRKLNLSQLEEVESLVVLTIDDSSNVGFRSASDLLSEEDTLDTVTTRGDSTNNNITVGDMKFQGALLDNQDRRLVIYDSLGDVLWGE